MAKGPRFKIAALISRWIVLTLLLSSCSQKTFDSQILSASDSTKILNRSKSHKTTLGNTAAQIQIAVFQDVNCGMCRKMWREVINGTLKEAIENDKVGFRLMEYPLGLAPNSSAIAIALKCAGEQGKYRDFLEAVYSTKGEHGEEQLTMLARNARVNIPKLSNCINSGKGKELAKLDIALGKSLGVQGTPTFFINGEELKQNWTDPGIWAKLLDTMK